MQILLNFRLKTTGETVNLSLIYYKYNRNHSFYKTILLRYNADNKSGADGAAV